MTFDKIEWYDICRKLRPGLMWDDYEVIWQDFLDHMRRRELHSARDQTHALAETGHLNERGQPFNPKSIVAMVWRKRHKRVGSNGAPITLVSQTLGHADLKTTSVYAHAKPNESSSQLQKQAQACRRSKPSPAIVATPSSAGI